MTTETGSLHEVQRPGVAVERVLRPASWNEALQLLGDFPGARFVAGGTDVVVELTHGQGPPVTLIDLTGIAGYRQISESADSFVLAGGVTHNQIVADRRFRDHALPLAQACLEIGSPQLRNRATLAGNLVTASPAGDSLTALLALDATVVLSRLRGAELVEREVKVADFFTGFRTTACEAEEMITAIQVPKLSASQRGIWAKLGLRRAQAISVVHAAIVIDVEESGAVVDARLALGSLAATVYLDDQFASLLVGRSLDDETIDNAARSVADAIAPIDDVRATADYRTDTTAAVIRRMLQALAAGDEASMWPVDPPTLVGRGSSAAPASSEITDADDVSVTINGTAVSGRGAASTTLLDWIRDVAGADGSAGPLSGIKEGCAEGECGACTVTLDGAAVMSCLVPAAQADGAEIVTIEGIGDGDGDTLHPLQDAFVTEFAVQCGFCIPGFLVAGASLLDQCPNPSDEQISLGLSGNLCRCTGYYPIVQAVRVASANQESGS